LIDLHCHLLPAVDDGPTTLEESLAMARLAREDGIHTIVVTPHAREWEQRCPHPDLPTALDEAIHALQQRLRESGIDLELVPGMEVDLDEALSVRLQDGRARPLGCGPYVLIELPFLGYAHYIDQAIFQAQVAGWRPVLAHVERYVYFQKQPKLLEALVQRGVLAQISAPSLLGDLGAAARGTALRFLRRGLVHCLATDAHGSFGVRAPLLSSAVSLAAHFLGKERAEAMVKTVPERILAGKSVDEVLAPLGLG